MDRMKKKMGYDYARGKDANRLFQKLDQDLMNKNLKNKKRYNNNRIIHKIHRIHSKYYVLLLWPIKYIGQFKNKWQDFNPYENYDNYAATVAVPGQLKRDQVIQHFQEQMNGQFRAGLKSGGIAQTTNKQPIVKFINDTNNQSNQKQKKQ
ncbi:unnamed protein product [Paramecium primaurelia]|uniref:Uncharacterized protein n=1 Tax=Paramecium primaurelia TaxID=5886 RepID=A0A8S1PSY7_PARPR|nr:unnamed protein product [Paramecium primaurelia]